MAERRTCVSCQEPADFTVNLVAYKYGPLPAVTTSTKSIGICNECVEPKSPHYAHLGTILACWVMQVRNDLAAKAAAQQPADRKTTAGGQ